VICEIKDDGIGFVAEGEVDGHYGLRNMRQRVEELGGNFTIDSKVGEGTSITFQLSVY
jgi:signal transduction histidine kinase